MAIDEAVRADRIRLYWAAGFYILAMAAQMSGVTNGWVALGLTAVATAIFLVAIMRHDGINGDYRMG